MSFLMTILANTRCANKIIEHIKTSMFRHDYMFLLTILIVPLVAILELLAIAGIDSITKNSLDTTITIGNLHVINAISTVGNIVIQVTSILLFVFVAYVLIIRVSYHSLVMMGKAEPEQYPEWMTWIKAIAAIGLAFLIIGINKSTITVAVILISVLIIPHIFKDVWDALENKLRAFVDKL